MWDRVPHGDSRQGAGVGGPPEQCFAQRCLLEAPWKSRRRSGGSFTLHSLQSPLGCFVGWVFLALCLFFFKGISEAIPSPLPAPQRGADSARSPGAGRPPPPAAPRPLHVPLLQAALRFSSPSPWLSHEQEARRNLPPRISPPHHIKPPLPTPRAFLLQEPPKVHAVEFPKPRAWHWRSKRTRSRSLKANSSAFCPPRARSAPAADAKTQPHAADTAPSASPRGPHAAGTFSKPLAALAVGVAPCSRGSHPFTWSSGNLLS